MSREEIMQDIKFRKACDKYGLNYKTCEVYGEVIVLSSPIFNLYVLMDKNYNTFCIDKLNPELESLEEFVNKQYETYCNYIYMLNNSNCPVEEFTLKQITDISNRIKRPKLGRSLRFQVDDFWYEINEKESEDHYKILSYIRLLRLAIDQYFLLSYQNHLNSLKSPDIYTYLSRLVDRIDISGSLFDIISLYISEEEQEEAVKMTDEEAKELSQQLVKSIHDLLKKL